MYEVLTIRSGVTELEEALNLSISKSETAFKEFNNCLDPFYKYYEKDVMRDFLEFRDSYLSTLTVLIYIVLVYISLPILIFIIIIGYFFM